MTFIAAFHSRRTIWLIADRRLTVGSNVKSDKARKVFDVTGTDGQALIGYAGLGATAKGIEPSEWMSRVLRGRSGTIEQYILAIANAMKAEMPKHLRFTASKGQASHMVLAAAFEGGRPRTFTIDLGVDRRGKVLGLNCQRWIPKPTLDLPPRLTFIGSGAKAAEFEIKPLVRPLFRVAKAFEEGKANPHMVADLLANLAFKVHRRDKFTGPSTIVVWRRYPGAKGWGGGHAYYENSRRVRHDGMIPTISRGTDIEALIGVVTPYMMKSNLILLQGLPDPGLDFDAMGADLSKLPDQPDVTLD